MQFGEEACPVSDAAPQHDSRVVPPLSHSNRSSTCKDCSRAGAASAPRPTLSTARTPGTTLAPTRHVVIVVKVVRSTSKDIPLNLGPRIHTLATGAQIATGKCLTDQVEERSHGPQKSLDRKDVWSHHLCHQTSPVHKSQLKTRKRQRWTTFRTRSSICRAQLSKSRRSATWDRMPLAGAPAHAPARPAAPAAHHPVAPPAPRPRVVAELNPLLRLAGEALCR